MRSTCLKNHTINPGSNRGGVKDRDINIKQRVHANLFAFYFKLSALNFSSYLWNLRKNSTLIKLDYAPENCSRKLEDEQDS
ncbi:hypothetical protein SAMN05660236_3237 [Ohtaekwangia koreensis]|uniref:Uncharacterized protein n=1 Tax=Ohtaekwangia koreensis TaxID=688867 RepID=A0A1T5LHP6_9BACT|nr:hypothetical protein SAMN05660236_3237 [Ohtaekwangia koreensis]